MPRSLLLSLLLPWLLTGCPGDTDDDSGDDDTTPPADDDSGDDDDDTASDDDSAAHLLPPCAPVSDVSVELHPDVGTVLVVTWTQDEAADAAWIEYGFEEELWLSTQPVAAGVGEHSLALLGIPQDRTASLQIFNQFGDAVVASAGQWYGTTTMLPAELPQPMLIQWDEALASSERWLFASIELQHKDWYEGPWFLFVIDRRGRIVWYRETPDNFATMHAKVSRDGTHLIWEETSIYEGDHGEQSRLRRATLDLTTYDEEIAAPFLGSTFDETAEGTILLDDYTDFPPHTDLVEQHPDGSRTTIWGCMDWAVQYDLAVWGCDPNETLWFPDTDTILWSMWASDTVVEIDRQTGELLRQFGRMDDSWRFDPIDSAFDMQHYPNYTRDGTLLVSTHMPREDGQQRAWEYELDDETQTLTVIWGYGEGVDHYARYAGEAQRLDNGHTLINYGTGADLREVTPDGDVVWEVQWAADYNIGHVTLIGDLYDVNRGP